MRSSLFIVTLGLVSLAALASGCSTGQSDESADDEPLGAAASPQIDGGTRTYLIQQAGVTTAAAWAGPIGAGTPVEYWVKKSSYAPAGARTFTGSSQSCADWKSTVCSSTWAGASFYKAVYTQTTLNCMTPPDPCRAPTNSESFLGAGSYRTLDSAGAAFAWTYVSGKCEYWSMHHTIGAGTNTQSPLSLGYSSLSDFETQMCAMSPVPSTWYTAYYVPFADFCSSSTC